MDLTRFTSIARPVDPAWPTNRAIAALAALAAAGTAAVVLLAGRGDAGAAAALGEGLVAGVSVFLAWALARELDPDRDLAAFAAALLGLVAVSGLGTPRFAAVFLVLLALRVVNRTVGPPARTGDTLAILALA
ncbi:MAG: hypothetical protein RRA92_09750, partial [Gemmatimonadota bacterium]|nr:hypothetical protein [Gemmatimonadota bacterium]